MAGLRIESYDTQAAANVVDNRYRLQAPLRRGLFFAQRNMNADLERLIALQKLDTTADEARKRLAGEPEQEQALEARLDAARQHVAAAKEQLTANKNARAALEKDVAVQQGRLSKFRETAMAVKTNQEYHAVQHEITFAQAEIKKIEDAILERMMESDELTAALKTAETQLATETKAVEAERRAGTAAHAEMEASLERIAVERGALIAGLNKDVLATFEAVARKRNGVAMSEARGGICTICHVRLRPQVFNSVLRNDSILQCDHCNRILYYVPVPASAATAPANPSPQPAS
jgi:predicted  nucleic acid-binding Zn-ribbon protein